MTIETVKRPRDFEAATDVLANKNFYEDGQIRMEQRSVALAHRDGRLLDYVVTEGIGTELQPTLYCGGFLDVARTYGNRVSLAKQLATHGLGLIIARNDRRIPSVRDPLTGRKDAMLTHALNTLSIIEVEGLAGTTLPAIGFSAGGMVLPRTVQEADSRGWNCFRSANLALVAAAGLYPDETPVTLAGRFVGNTIRESLGFGMKFEPAARQAMTETVAAGSRAFRRNPGRALREYYELGSRKTDLPQLAGLVGQLAIVAHGHDRTTPPRLFDIALTELFAAADAPVNVRYFTPYSTKPDAHGRPLGVQDAHHLDCITNTARAADPIGRFLSRETME